MEVVLNFGGYVRRDMNFKIRPIKEHLETINVPIVVVKEFLKRIILMSDILKFLKNGIMKRTEI